MYTTYDELKSISEEIIGKKLIGIYPDWSHGIIYMHFYDSVKGYKIVSVKNNYYAGISILKEIQEELYDE